MARVHNYLIVIKYTGANWYNVDSIKLVSGRNMKEAVDVALELNKETFKGKEWCVYSITKLDNSIKSFDVIHGEDKHERIFTKFDMKREV